MTPPIIVSVAPECTFYRSGVDAIMAGKLTGARVFDATGCRFEPDGDGGLGVVSQSEQGAAELAAILRSWLAHVDALRESTANWSLELLVRAAVEHHGYSA